MRAIQITQPIYRGQNSSTIHVRLLLYVQEVLVQFI